MEWAWGLTGVSLPSALYSPQTVDVSHGKSCSAPSTIPTTNRQRGLPGPRRLQTVDGFPHILQHNSEHRPSHLHAAMIGHSSKAMSLVFGTLSNRIAASSPPTHHDALTLLCPGAVPQAQAKLGGDQRSHTASDDVALTPKLATTAPGDREMANPRRALAVLFCDI